MGKVLAFFDNPNDAFLPLAEKMKQVKKAGMDFESLKETKFYLGVGEEEDESVYLTFLTDEKEMIEEFKELWKYTWAKKDENNEEDEEEVYMDELKRKLCKIIEKEGFSYKEETVSADPVTVPAYSFWGGSERKGGWIEHSYEPSEKIYVIDVSLSVIQQLNEENKKEEKLKTMF